MTNETAAYEAAFPPRRLPTPPQPEPVVEGLERECLTAVVPAEGFGSPMIDTTFGVLCESCGRPVLTHPYRTSPIEERCSFEMGDGTACGRFPDHARHAHGDEEGDHPPAPSCHPYRPAWAEASRTPVETAVCGRETSGGYEDGYAMVVCEFPRGHYGFHHQEEPYCDWSDASCIFPDPDDPWWETQDSTFVPPSPEAVEPPLTARKAVFRDPSEPPLTDELDPDCAKCRQASAPPHTHEPVPAAPREEETAGTGGEAGGVRSADAADAYTDHTRNPSIWSDYERGFHDGARDAEERARTELRHRWVRLLTNSEEALQAAEERATQAEGQREALETALREAHGEHVRFASEVAWKADYMRSSDRTAEGSIEDLKRFAEAHKAALTSVTLSPSTEAPSGEARALVPPREGETK